MPPAPSSAQPVRTCVGCRKRGARSELLRVVVAGDGDQLVVVPDPGARLPGRGAWLHPRAGCLALAERRRAFGRALRVQGLLGAPAVRVHLDLLVGQEHPAPPPARTAGAAPPSTTHPLVTDHRKRVIT